MSFLFGNTAKVDRRPTTPAEIKTLRPEAVGADKDRCYSELMSRRPALLDEKLKLHARIIDEFNLALLEKLSADDMRREVQAYVAKYMRAERISLNQNELQEFTSEVLAEMIGFGPIEPLLKDPTVSDISDQYPQSVLRRALRQAGARQCPFQGRSASASHHQ